MQEVVLQSEGDLVVASARWQGDELVAQIQRQQQCQSARRENVVYQRVKVRQTRGEWWEIGGGMAGVLGGVAAFACAPFVRTPHNDQVAFISGGVLAAIGLPWLIHGVVIAARGADRNDGGSWTEVEDRNPGDRVICGTLEPPAGDIEMHFGIARVQSLRIADGRIAIQPRKLASTICTNEAMIDVPLRIRFAPDGGRPLDVSTWNAGDCIRAVVAGRLLAEVASEAEEASSVDGATRIAAKLAHAQERIAEMSRDDPDRARLESRLAQVQSESRHVLARNTDGLVAAFHESVLADGLEGSANSAGAAIALAHAASPEPRKVWDKVYDAFLTLAMRQGSPAMPALRGLLASDPVTRRCLESEDCPAWLDTAATRKKLAAFFDKVGRDISSRVGGFEATVRAVRPSTPTPWFDRMDKAERLAQEVRPWCVPATWNPRIAERCTALQNAMTAAADARTAHEEYVLRTRKEKTAQTLKAHFEQCRTTTQARDGMARVADCDADCQLVRARLDADVEALRGFSYERGSLSELDSDVLDALRRECQDAHCPSCF